MKINLKQSIFGSIVAFFLATSCCWLPWIIISIGGVAGFTSLTNGLGKASGLFMILGLGFLCVGFVQFYKTKTKIGKPILISTITCPNCNHQKTEEMPTDACQYFYECENCKTVLKPKGTDCCVFCSYGTVDCPPIQKGEDCC